MIDSVPLIQNANDAQQINASIIAMKKASRELDEKIAQFNKLLSQEITNREKAITEAINSLDVSSVGGSGKYISAISETDGKISATASDITSTVSSGNSQPVTSGGVAEELITNTMKNGTWGLLGGAKVATSKNFEDLLNNEIAGTYDWGYGIGGIVGGSIYTTTSSLGIGTGWWNLLYIPHRTGTGASGSDNRKFGVLYVTSMSNNNSGFYIIHRHNGTNLTANVFTPKTDTIARGVSDCITSGAVYTALNNKVTLYNEITSANLGITPATKTITPKEFFQAVYSTYGAGTYRIKTKLSLADAGFTISYGGKSLLCNNAIIDVVISGDISTQALGAWSAHIFNYSTQGYVTCANNGSGETTQISLKTIT